MAVSTEQYNFPGLPESRKITHRHYPGPPPPLSAADRQEIAAHLRDKACQSRNFKKKTKLTDEAERFCQCGSSFSLWKCVEDDETFRVPMSCHSRICERCGRMYARRITPDLHNILRPLLSQRRRGWGLFLLTLTTDKARYEGMPTRENIDRLYRESSNFFRLHYGKYQAYVTKSGKVIEDKRHFDYRREHGKVKRTRRQPQMIQTKKGPKADYRKFRGCGYISSLELGRNNNNLHIHAVVYGPYIPQSQLVESWKKLSKDSFIVDIRAIRELKAAAWYVLKYIVKPPAVDSYDALAEYAIMIKGSRRLRAGGIFFDRIHTADLDKVEFSCPYCRGRLQSQGNIGKESHQFENSQPLYKLLREVRARGDILPLDTVDRAETPVFRAFCRMTAREIFEGVTDCEKWSNTSYWPGICRQLQKLC
jgi:hypothetical protein